MLVVYPPFNDPHMLTCRSTCHDQTQFLCEPCQVVNKTCPCSSMTSCMNVLCISATMEFAMKDMFLSCPDASKTQWTFMNRMSSFCRRSSVGGRILEVQVVLLVTTVSLPCVLEDVMMESAHCTVTSITLRTRVSLKRGLLDQFVRDSPVGLLACTRTGDVVVYLDNFTFPLASDITCLSVSLHTVNRFLTFMFTTTVIWEVMWQMTVKVLNLYALPQKRHLGCSLSQPSDCFLTRTVVEIVLRSSSWSVSCSGAVVWSFCMSSPCFRGACEKEGVQNLKWIKQILNELYFPQFRQFRQMTWGLTSGDVRITPHSCIKRSNRTPTNCAWVGTFLSVVCAQQGVLVETRYPKTSVVMISLFFWRTASAFPEACPLQ